MKTLIISDIHLNGVFDEKKYLFLEHLFSSVDHIILNGDIWDGYQSSFEEFITSKWKGLFPLLKEKNAVYLFGNQDRKKYSDDRASLFSASQKDSYELTENGETYHIEHGHLMYKTVDIAYPLSKKFPYFVTYVLQPLEYILIKAGSPHNFIIRRANEKMKTYLKAKKFPHWYICGHTHFAEIDTKNKYANSGFIQFGLATYLIIDSSGLSLHTDHY